MSVISAKAIEARNSKLREMLAFLLKHPRFGYAMKDSRYMNTFNHQFGLPFSIPNRWHVMSVDWSRPWTSIWTAVWHNSTNISDREYLELLQLTKQMDQEAKEDGCLVNLPGCKVFYSKINNLIKE